MEATNDTPDVGFLQVFVSRQGLPAALYMCTVHVGTQ